MPDRYTMFAGYNAWANARIYDAASALSDADYRADRGAFFKSVHGTLNHLLVADRIWMRRFTGEGPSPTRLDQILFEDFSELRDARRAEDQRIVDYIAGLTDADLNGPFRYRTITNPVTIEQPLAPALDHFFNHQAHHRGQISTLIHQICGEMPSIDLIIYQRDQGFGRSRVVD